MTVFFASIFKALRGRDQLNRGLDRAMATNEEREISVGEWTWGMCVMFKLVSSVIGWVGGTYTDDGTRYVCAGAHEIESF